MRKAKYDNHQQYYLDHKNLALQKLLGKPLEKSYLNLIGKPSSSPPKNNESFKQSPKNLVQKPQTSYVSQAKLKTHTSSSNLSGDEHPTIQSIGSDTIEDRKHSPSQNQISAINNLYGLSARCNINRKPLIQQPTYLSYNMDRPTSSKTSVNINSHRTFDNSKDSCGSGDSQKRIQTSYIDLKQPIANLTKEENNDLYKQIIRMRCDTSRSEQPKHCPLHAQVEIKFSNLERTTEYCALCAIEQAYKGHPLIYLPTQQILTPSLNSKGMQPNLGDIIWNVDVICQQQGVLHLATQEQQQKKLDLQGFITYLQRTHDYVASLINDYQQYQLSQDILITNKQAIETLGNQVSLIVKKSLSQTYHPIDQNTLKRVLPDKIRFLRSFQNDIQCIRNDIVQNLENILKQMEMDPFQLILQKYGTKIKTFEHTLTRSHSNIQEQFGICFGWSLQINEAAQAQLTKWVNSILKGDSELQNQPEKCKQVYVSFENKESFKAKAVNKENEYEKTFDNSEIVQMQRQSQTSKFVDLLNKINSNQNQKTSFLTSLLTPVPEATVHLTQDHYLSRDEHPSKGSWKDIQKSPQFKDIDQSNHFY